MKRSLSTAQKQAVYVMADGKCQICGKALGDDWEADHITPFSSGGPTDLKNSQALCKKCNRKKGDFIMPTPRGWQVEMLDAYQGQQDFLLVATPGAGKTMGGGFVAHRQILAGEIDYVIVVAPDVYLKEQWAIKTQKNFKILLHPAWNGRPIKENFRGICVTYSQVSNSAEYLDYLCSKHNTLVIFDEIHHAGDQLSWGEGIKTAFENAKFRLGLSGTPFRSDNNPIPFVTYKDGRSVADFSYGYGHALKDGVCRNVGFRVFDALVTWVDNATGEVYDDVSFDDELKSSDIPRRLSIALDEHNEYLRDTLKEADNHLNIIRENEDPNAGGLIVTKDTNHATGIAQAMKEITGEMPVVVHSEIEKEKGKAKQLIERYAKSGDKWIVAVQMVSEGVDIPRLRVGVYATTITTELTFRQIIGRIIRRMSDQDDWAFFYVPKDPRLVSLMEVIKEEREHVLHDIDDQKKRDKETRERIEHTFPLWVGFAERNQPGDVMITDGETFEDSFVKQAKEIAAEVGIRVNDAQATLLVGTLIERGLLQLPAEKQAPANKNGIPEYRKERLLRKQCSAMTNGLAGQWMERLNRPIGEIISKLHAASKRHFGKAQGDMTTEELQQKIEWLNSIKDKHWKVL